MSSIATLLFLLYLVMPCTAFYVSPLIRFEGRSLDTASALKQAAQVLNVPQPGTN